MADHKDCKRYDDCDFRNDVGWCPESCAQYKHKDDERVVMCRDCQWYGNERACPLAASGLSADCIKLPKEDDFCSYGERRKDNG